MMDELKGIKAAVNPSDTLLVVDAMTGQEAASLVKTFNDEAGITGASRAWLTTETFSHPPSMWIMRVFKQKLNDSCFDRTKNQQKGQ